MNTRGIGMARKPVGSAAARGFQAQRKCACGTHTPDGGPCSQCANKQTAVQRKLAIGGTRDRYEREADHTADTVLASAPATPRAQPVSAWQAAAAPHAVPASVDRVLRDSGTPMSPPLRREMETRFGHDFSQVRLHTDDSAAQSARVLHAHAYTAGPHIVFDHGRLAPASVQGRHLLAHELTHVLQQRASPTAALQRQPADDAGVDAPTDASVAPAPTVDAGPTPATGPAPATTLGTPATPAIPTRDPANDAEATADAQATFPDDASVEAAIGGMKPEVQRQINAKMGSDADSHRRFLARCSLYLGAHPKTVEHFAAIEPFQFADRTTLFLHHRAVERLTAVQGVIGEKNMPSTDVGFGLRDRVSSKAVLFPGQMVHAMGYAIDFRAATNPRIPDKRLVATQALFKEQQTAFRVDTGPWKTRRQTIKGLGSGKLQPDSTQGKAFLEAFREEGQKDVQGNSNMLKAVTPPELKTLKDLRDEYKAMLARKKILDASIVAARKKGSQSLPAELIKAATGGSSIIDLVAEGAKLTLSRTSVIARTRTILSRLIDMADADIKKVSAQPHVTENADDLKKAMVRLTAASQTAKQAVAQLDKDVKKAEAEVARHRSEVARLDAALLKEKAPPPGRPSNPRADRANAERLAKDQDKRNREAEALSKADDARKQKIMQRISAGKQQSEADEALQEGLDAPNRRRWLADLQSLQDGLSVEHFSERLVFGIGDKDAEADRAVVNPSLVQLFSKGFFNVDPTPSSKPAPTTSGKSSKATKPMRTPTPRSGFDLRFMEEMVKHGFDQGSQWDAGGVDSMHFELAEAVDEMHVPKDAKAQTAPK